MVDHHCERLSVGAAQPLNGHHFAILGNAEFTGHFLVGMADAVVEQLSGGLLTGTGQIVEKACQLDATVYRILYHLSADAAFANEQALVDKFLYCPPSRRPRQRQSLS